MKKNVEDSFSAFLTENADFTKVEGYPILTKEMISETVPIDIITFKEALKLPVSERKKYYVCTFSKDNSFKRIKRNPKMYVDFFKSFDGLIGFDYSIHSDMPPIVQKSQMYDNLALTYFYGNKGIKVIPNIRTGSNYISEEFFESIPKNSLVAVGTHGFIKSKTQKYEWYYFLKYIIEKIEPCGIIIYGTLRGKLFDEIKQTVPVYQYDSWMEKRNKDKKKVKNGN